MSLPKLKLTDYIDKAFKVLPENSFIHKGRCGIGGTTLELNAERNTIIVVPTVGIIEDKRDETNDKGELEYPDLLCVYGEFLEEDIVDFLMDDIPYKKIMVTPDSLPKIVRAANSILMEEELFADYYIMLDECHSPITERYRKKMVDMIEIFFKFENKIVLSATPFYFNDPRFKKLQQYRITFKEEYLGDILVVESPSVQQTVNLLLTEKKKVSGNLHIFYNSVTEIAEAVRKAGLKDCNIYCADEARNMKKLDDVQCFFKPKPITGEYKKFNFYTTRYFEGWSLRDIKPTIVLVTDVYKKHTKVGITNKGVQAIGRVRIDKDKPDSRPEYTIHITNHRKTQEFKSLQEITKDYLTNANYLVKEYNDLYKGYCEQEQIDQLKDKKETLLKFATINQDDNAKLSYTKTDQIINEDACNEEFNYIYYIHEAWNRAGFKTYQDYFYKKKDTKENKERLTAKMLKQIFEEFKSLDPKKGFNFNFLVNNADNNKRLEYLRQKYPIHYEAYKKLPEEDIIKVKYKQKELEKLLILVNHNDTEIQVKKLLDKYFTVGKSYTNTEIQIKLQQIYNAVERKEKPEAIHLRKYKWYEMKPYKVQDKKDKNKYHNGYIIIRKTFGMKVATE
jgi:hypothetical protein